MKIDQLCQQIKTFHKMAQMVSAQPGDIQTALENAKLWNIAPAVSPLLDAAGVPDDAKVNISISVHPGNQVNYSANLTPNNSNVSQKLSGLLKQKFAPPMSKALQTSKLNVSNPVAVNWLNF